MQKKIKTVLSGMIVFALLGSAMTLSAKDKIKAGFVYVGPVSDHGWTYQHDQARLAAEKAFGDKLETVFVESVPESGSERVIRKMAAEKNDIIFTTSFGYMNPTVKVAGQNPKVIFEHNSGFKRAKNVGTYNGRFYEGRYPVGVLAGKMTKSNIIGYVASFPIPEVVMGINATLLGARSVNPKAEIRVVWVSSWYDPGKEADAAKTLINQGADVIMQHTDSPAPLQIAEEKGVWAVGQASDMSKFAPKAHLTAIVNDWSGFYIDRIQQVMDGTWKSQDVWYGLKEGWIKLAPLNPAVPADAKAAVEQTIADIKSGKRHPFMGPIKKQDGSEWVKAGETLSDADILKMNEYVEGIVGSLPN